MAWTEETLRPVQLQPRATWPALWPFVLIWRIWTSAVADDRAVRFNLRLLAALTAVCSAPDIVQGLFALLHAASAGGRLYAVYVLVLALFELAGAALLACRRRAGRWCILGAAAGFYVEAVLGLAGFERGLIAIAIFAACAPAEAWVIWFLSHPRVRCHLDSAYS